MYGFSMVFEIFSNYSSIVNFIDMLLDISLLVMELFLIAVVVL